MSKRIKEWYEDAYVSETAIHYGLPNKEGREGYFEFSIISFRNTYQLDFIFNNFNEEFCNTILIGKFDSEEEAKKQATDIVLGIIENLKSLISNHKFYPYHSLLGEVIGFCADIPLFKRDEEDYRFLFRLRKKGDYYEGDVIHSTIIKCINLIDMMTSLSECKDRFDLIINKIIHRIEEQLVEDPNS